MAESSGFMNRGLRHALAHGSMRNRLMVFGLAFAVCGLSEIGCKKAKSPTQPEPHSADALLLRLQDQSQLFNEAIARKDYQYLHDYGSYFNSLAQSLLSRLNDQQKQRLQGSVDELIVLSNQLDLAAGGHHQAATEATVQRVQAVLKNIDMQFRAIKNGGV
jgi:hypothetical protein